MLSTKPYLVRALWSWCCDADFTPYLTVWVDDQCRVPQEFVRDGTITLNLSPSATGHLDIGNEWVTLSARFGGVSRDLFVHMGAVIGICAKENGVGLEFAYEPIQVADSLDPTESIPEDTLPDASEKKYRAPHLQRIK